MAQNLLMFMCNSYTGIKANPSAVGFKTQE